MKPMETLSIYKTTTPVNTFRVPVNNLEILSKTFGQPLEILCKLQQAYPSTKPINIGRVPIKTFRNLHKPLYTLTKPKK